MSVTVSLVTFQPFLIVFAYFKSYHIYSHNIVDTPPCFLANGYNIWIRWRLGRNTCQETTILFHEILRMRQHSPGGRMKMTHSHYQEAPLSFNKTVKTSRWSADSHSRLPPPFFFNLQHVALSATQNWNYAFHLLFKKRSTGSFVIQAINMVPSEAHDWRVPCLSKDFLKRDLAGMEKS